MPKVLDLFSNKGFWGALVVFLVPSARSVSLHPVRPRWSTERTRGRRWLGFSFGGLGLRRVIESAMELPITLNMYLEGITL